MKLRRGWTSRGVACLTALSLAGCGAGDGGPRADAGLKPEAKVEGSAEPSGREIAISGLDVDSLDPVTGLSPEASQISAFLYDRLIFQRADGKLVPYLARSWKQRDALTWSFEVRTDATCADGTKLGSEAIARGLRPIATSDTENTPTVFGEPGAKITAEGPTTVVVRLPKPFADLPLGLAQPVASVICPSGLQSQRLRQRTSHGSGPYRLTGLKRGSAYTMTRRDDYSWGPNGFKTTTAGVPSRIEYRPVENQTTRANQVVAGELDLVPILGRDVDRLVDNPSLTKAAVPNAASSYLWLNHREDSPTADPKVRQAVASAIDRSDIGIAEVGKEKFDTVTSVVPDFVDGFDAETKKLVQPYDLKRAAGLLEEAGYRKNGSGKYEKDGRTLRLRVSGYDGQNQSPEYVVSQLEKLGAEATLTKGTQNDWFEVLSAFDYDVGVITVGLEYPSVVPTVALLYGSPTEGSNWSSIPSDPQISAAIEAGKSAADGGERDQAWSKLQRWLLENHHYAPTFAPKQFWFGNNISFSVAPGSGLILDPFSVRSYGS